MKFTLDTNTVELVLGLLGIVGWLFRLSSRVGVWEEKFKHTDEFVADMRKIFITNSLLDAQRRGVLQVSSPLRPNQAILDAFGDLGVRIVRHYNENGLSRESNDVVVFKLWRTFGEELTEFARGLHLNLSDVLMSALYLAKENR